MKDLLFSFRKLKRNPLLLFVCIPGLAIGLSIVLLLVCYLRREYSFDKHFNTKNRVLRLYNMDSSGQYGCFGICLRKAYDEIPSQISEISAATQLFNDYASEIKTIQKGEIFKDVQTLYADNGYMDVFGQQLLLGNSTEALKGKNKIVLSKSSALKYFGTTDCVGQELEMEAWGDPLYTVSGVIEDLPDNSHFRFDVLVSMETLPLDIFKGMEFQTYFLIKEGSDVKTAEKKIEHLNEQLMQPFIQQNDFPKMHSTTRLLRNVHFFTPSKHEIVPTANLKQIYLVGSIAILVLLIALVNFVNIYTLHSETRLNEIAMRKSLGASRMRLLKLFLTDNLMIAGLAFILALLLTAFVAPYFSELLNTKVRLAELYSLEGSLSTMLILLAVILSSGLFHLHSLSKNNLALAVKGKSNNVHRKQGLSRTALLLQFSITAFLLTNVLIFFAQTRYLKSIPLGFNTEHLELFKVSGNILYKKMNSIKEEVQDLPYVESVAFSEHSLGNRPSSQKISKYGSSKSIDINEYRVGMGFTETVQIELAKGKYFDNEQSKEILINETAMRALEIEDPVGKKVLFRDEPYTIKGVLKDFYYTDNPGKEIAPIMLTLQNNYGSTLYVRSQAKLSAAQKVQIAKVFRSFDKEYQLNSQSINDVFANNFKKEDKTMKMVGTGTLLAILLCISGLIALSLDNVKHRTKEIGIRKVMGSSETQIFKLLVSRVLYWVLTASLIGFVFSYWVMSGNLEHFAKRIPIHPIYFLTSALLIVLITLISVGWQSWRAASRNPVDALRYE